MSKFLTPSIVRMPGLLEERANMINILGCERIHIDVSIGYSIPDFFVCGQLSLAERSLFNAPADFHVFRQGNDEGYEMLPFRSGDRLILHMFPWTKPESVTDMVNHFRQRGFAVGLSLDLGVSLELLLPSLISMNVALIMGIEAGGYGAPLNQKALATLTECRAMIQEGRLAINLGIDGGVNAGTFESLAILCDFLVVGGLLFNAPDIVMQWRSLNAWLRRFENGG